MARATLSKKEREQLAATLRCSPRELTSKLGAYEAAALEEYLRMFLGQRVLTRGQDIREYRLCLLIQHVFEGELPDERMISDLFQTTAGQSRSLLRAVMSKYQYELQEGITATLRKTVQGASQTGTGGPWIFSTDSENRIDALNREISTLDPTLPQITKRARTVATYEIANSSYVDPSYRPSMEM